MLKIKMIFGAVLAALLLFTFSGYFFNPVFAQNATGTVNQNGSCGTGFTYVNGLCVLNSQFSKDSIANTGTIFELITKVLKIMLTLAGALAVVWLVIGGYQYITAGGNDEQAEKGRKTLLNATIGVVVVIMAYALINVVVNLVANGKTG